MAKCTYVQRIIKRMKTKTEPRLKVLLRDIKTIVYKLGYDYSRSKKDISLVCGADVDDKILSLNALFDSILLVLSDLYQFPMVGVDISNQIILSAQVKHIILLLKNAKKSIGTSKKANDLFFVHISFDMLKDLKIAIKDLLEIYEKRNMPFVIPESCDTTIYEKILAIYRAANALALSINILWPLIDDTINV